MGVLIAGLTLFLGVHSVRIFGVRDVFARALGPQFFMIIYALISAAGLALIIYGKMLAHPSASLWAPPGWTRFLPLILTPIALILVLAPYARGRLRILARHPMTLGVLIWSGGHLAANGDLSSVVLFGAFFVWSLALAVRLFSERGGYAGPGSLRADVIVITLGLVMAGLTAVFHMQLFGVAVVELASEIEPSGI